MTVSLGLDLGAIAWPETAGEAMAMQNALRGRMRTENDFANNLKNPPLQTVAGVDVSYDIKDNISRAVVVLMRLDTLTPFAIARAYKPTTFPYIPGLLSFREIPVVLEAIGKLPEAPDLLMVDGQGIAHPRRLGIAAHLGVLLDIPSLGVAKSRLTGRHADVGPHKGDTAILYDKKERIGTVLRSKDNTLPLYISPGHRLDQDTALEIVIKCLTKYRLPEPTRIADKLTKSDPAKDSAVVLEMGTLLNLSAAS